MHCIHRCKYHQEKTCKLYSVAYEKDYIQRSSGLYPKNSRLVNTWTSVNIIHYINRLSTKYFIIVSIDAEIPCVKVSAFFHDENILRNRKTDQE